jgi:hypothetical protein
MSKGVKVATLKKAIALLSALQTEFIIKTEEGDLYTLGNLILADDSKRTRVCTEPRGMHKDFLIAAGLDAMQIGEVLVIPKGEFQVDAVQRRASSRACALWGNGSATTAVVGDNVEILRIN